MRILENGVYRNATEEEFADSMGQEESKMEPTLEERLAALESLFAEKEAK